MDYEKALKCIRTWKDMCLRYEQAKRNNDALVVLVSRKNLVCRAWKRVCRALREENLNKRRTTR